MKRLLFAPLALAALLFSTQAASAAPRPPHHLSPREQARWEAQHRPAPRPQPEAFRYHRAEPLPPHRGARLPQPPVPPRPPFR